MLLLQKSNIPAFLVYGENSALLVKVEQVLIFSSFFDAYKKFSKSYFGYGDMTMEEMINKIYTIYTKEQEELMGVLAMKFKEVDLNDDFLTYYIKYNIFEKYELKRFCTFYKEYNDLSKTT